MSNHYVVWPVEKARQENKPFDARKIFKLKPELLGKGIFTVDERRKRYECVLLSPQHGTPPGTFKVRVEACTVVMTKHLVFDDDAAPAAPTADLD